MKLLFFDSDEDASDEDEEMKFYQHPYEDNMDVDNISHDDDRNANVITSNVTGSVWKRYDSTNSDLQRFSFNVSNPGIRLPSCGHYNKAINFFQLFFQMILSRNLFMKQTGMHEKKIEKLLLLSKRSIQRSRIDTTLEEMKVFLESWDKYGHEWKMGHKGIFFYKMNT